MHRSLLTLCLAFLLAPRVAPAAVPLPVEPMGIALENFPYPHPVEFLQLTVQGQVVRLAYMDIQSNQPSTVVLLHGKNFFGAYWQETIQALSKAGFRVVVPDQIGFGKSGKPDIHYSFDCLAEQTIYLLDQLGVREAAVVGHSMGGMLAVRLARNYPGRITSLVLENPLGLEDYRFKIPPQSIPLLFEKELKDTNPEKIRAFYRQYVVAGCPETFEPYATARARVALSGEYPRWAMASALTYQMIYQQPVVHEFPLLTQPTLLVIGQADRTTLGRGLVSEETLQSLGQYPELGRLAAKTIPKAHLVELPRIGHIPHLEAPALFHQHLTNFLNKAR